MRIREIWRFPVKSAQGESVGSSAVTDHGLEWDRQLAVVDATTGKPLTARREPKLLLLGVAVDGATIRLATPEGQPLASDAELSAWLGRDVTLNRPPGQDQPEYESPADFEDESGQWTSWKGPAGVWHDSTRTRVSVVSAASLGDWSVRRFRPNVLLDEGDEVSLVGRRIALGGVVLDVVKRIERCVMVTRPQPGGLERDLDVLRAVHREHGGFLGVGSLVAVPGVLAVGDELRDLGPVEQDSPCRSTSAIG